MPVETGPRVAIRMITSGTPRVFDVIMLTIMGDLPQKLCGRWSGRFQDGSVRRVTDLSSLGSTSLGVWTRAEALQLLTPGQVDVLVRTRTWQVLWRGVYADGGVVVTAEQRAIAAVLAVDGRTRSRAGASGQRRRAVACGRTAARVWQIPLIDDDDPATGASEHALDEVAVGRRLPRQSYGGRLLVPHQRQLVRSDVVRLASGLWVTTPLRTLVDCAAELSQEALGCAIDGALHHELVTTGTLSEGVAARRGAIGGPALASAAALADGRAEAPTETLARLLLLPHLPNLEPQVELFDAAARLVARFDLADRVARLAVEADGKRGHAGTQMVAKDRQRDRSSSILGWTTERVTWFELRRQQAAFVRRVVQQHEALLRRRPAA